MTSRKLLIAQRFHADLFVPEMLNPRNVFPLLFIYLLVYVARASVYLGEEDIANTYFNKVLRLIPGHIEANAALDRLSANVEDYWKI